MKLVDLEETRVVGTLLGGNHEAWCVNRDKLSSLLGPHSFHLRRSSSRQCSGLLAGLICYDFLESQRPAPEKPRGAGWAHRPMTSLAPTRAALPPPTGAFPPQHGSRAIPKMGLLVPNSFKKLKNIT